MESRGARLAVLAVAIGAVVALFLALSEGEEERSQDAAAVETTTESRPGGGERPNRKPKPDPKPKPQIPAIEVRGGQPVGGVQQLDFASGERIRFRITSDRDAEFHLHGYDIERQVSGGGSTTFDLPADVEGVFELEDHETLAPIAEITVTPS